MVSLGGCERKGYLGSVLKVGIEAILVLVLFFKVEVCDGHLDGGSSPRQMDNGVGSFNRG